jgi:outer membrane receptor protein involved in Fe transport
MAPGSKTRWLWAGLCTAVPAGACLAQDDAAANPLASHIDVVQITATRFGEPVQEVPIAMTVITHDELAARGANDLRTALALLGGAGVAPGGDAGPAGATPALLGQRESDDFLLLIDGVPSGGAFVPLFETISLNNVERIEVLRGTAPVYFGTTAFAGTINVIHYAAGKASPDLTFSVGSHGSASVSGARALSTGPVKQSLAVELSHDQLSDPRTRWNRAQGSYRMALQAWDGDLRVDVNLQSLLQRPGSPTPVGDDGRLTDEVGPDFNQNPSDAHLDTGQAQLVLGYDKLLPLGRWTSTLSWTHTHVNSLTGFLVDGGLDIDEGDNAEGTNQSRTMHDLFFDTHVTDKPLPWLDLTYGLNELWGHAAQDSASFTYRVPPDGALPPPSSQGTPDETATLLDRRSFFGLYAQSRAKLSEDASLLFGLRWNRTTETRRALLAEADDEDDDDGEPLAQSQHTSRLSGSIGGLWEIWRDRTGDLDDVSIYANWGSTFQPTQIDFGVDDALDPLLHPETQRSFQAGLKADGFDGRWDFDLGAFFVDFDNQVVTADVNNTPTLQSGGRQRFKGVEFETSFRPVANLDVSLHGSWEDARYLDFATLIDDTPVNLAGNRLPLSPTYRAGAGVTWAPPRGLGFSLTADYTGPRWLDETNEAKVSGFTVVDASVSWRFDRTTLALTGTNLTNRRDPVLVSELGEGQIYRMPARRAFVTVTYRFE